MVLKNKIGAYTTDDNVVKVQMSGSKLELLELLAVLNAKFLLDTTSSAEEYRRVFERLQIETGTKYLVFKTDEYKNKKTNNGEDFLGETITD